MAKNRSKQTRAKRTPLSRQRVLDAAVALADRDGVDALSMRKLAAELGVEAMSLYRHVSNKDDVLAGITDMVVSQIELPVIGGNWRDEIRKRAASAHEVLLRHPWATMLIVSRGDPGPAMLRYVDATLGCLREAGFSFEMADHAWNAIDNHVYGFTLQKLNFPFEPEEYAAVAEAYLPMIPASQFPYLRGLSEQVIARNYDGLHDFEFGLNLILDGLERLLT